MLHDGNRGPVHVQAAACDDLLDDASRKWGGDFVGLAGIEEEDNEEDKFIAVASVAWLYGGTPFALRWDAVDRSMMDKVVS